MPRWSVFAKVWIVFVVFLVRPVGAGDPAPFLSYDFDDGDLTDFFNPAAGVDVCGTGLPVGVIYLANFLFLGGPRPPCLVAADVAGDGAVPGTTTDIIFLANFLFLGGAPPPAPGPSECAMSDRQDDLATGCEEPPPCD